MIRKLLFPLILLVGSAAFAQNEFEGLDLTDDPKKPAETKPGETKPAEAKPAESKPAALEPARKPVTTRTGPAVERDITQEDRVKSVQRKLYLKRGRFELAPG